MNLVPALIIDGRRVSRTSAQRINIINPSTEATIGSLPSATSDLLDEALLAAQRGFLLWKKTPSFDRARILQAAAQQMRKRIDYIADLITLENGKPILEARAEVVFGAEVFEWFAEEARRIHGRTVPSRTATLKMEAAKEPLGVVAAFSPWNAPIVTSAKKVAAALAAGCSVILKPSEETPSAPLIMAECLEAAGLPAGVLNVVFGDPPMISSHLLASSTVKKVTFTGSTAVGRHLVRMSADRLQRMTMELGGNAPVIIMDDVDPVAIANKASAAKFRSAGQICSSPTRFLIHNAVFGRFLDAFAANAQMIKVGDGFDPQTIMGPLINGRRLEAVEELTADAVARGATIVSGGKRKGNHGYFFEPTVMTEVPLDCRFMREEPFGPMASVTPFTDLDEALEIANDTDYGLASYVFTANSSIAERVCSVMQTGHVAINSFLTSMAETPFGGIKQSGYGLEGGIEGIEAFLATKFIVRESA